MSKDMEGAAAYLNDYTPWADMGDGQRREWQKRASALIDGSTRFGKFSQNDIAQLCGLDAKSTVSWRLAWSAAEDTIEDRQEREKRNRQRTERAVRTMIRRNPRMVEEALDKIRPTGEPEPLEPLEQKSDRPEDVVVMEFYGWYVRGKRVLDHAQEIGTLTPRARKELAEIADKVRALVDLVLMSAESGAWDEELAALLEEGR